MVREGDRLWTPRPEFAAAANITRFMVWLRERRQLAFADYEALWRWSVTDLEGFWGAVWEYFDVQSDAAYRTVIERREMPGARWFTGSRVNYAEHLLRHERGKGDGAVAIHHSSEIRPLDTMSWRTLGDQVRRLATSLRELGIGSGDRVVSYLPNSPEAVVAMLATIAIGAVWSAAAPEFGVKTVTERFGQIAPTLLFAADGYRFGGKDFRRDAEIAQIVESLPSLKHVVWLSYLDPQRPSPLVDALPWSALFTGPALGRDEFHYERVGPEHPLWVMFSSGTTGLPKAIVHNHVGILVELLKLMHFHLNLKPDSVMFFYTTTGWMMFNALTAALLAGSAIVLYDGHPTAPDPALLWKLAADTGTTNFGASPTFVQIMQKAGARPGEAYDLSRLDSVLLGGSPSTPETFKWFYDCVKEDLWVTSQSGGTEICSGLVGAIPTQPVYAGEIQVRSLGMDVHAWNDDGVEVRDEVGELVCTSPAPSMPIWFWHDEDGRRYREAYFDVFPGVWRHGDFIKINGRGGCYIYGRSDSTLNRFGVRIGTAEIYRAVEQIPAVEDSLIVCCELPDGGYFMPLFVKLRVGHALDDATVAEINGRLRRECSPRHVPDRIYAVDSVPYTLTGKKMEIPVRKLLMGSPVEKAASRDAMQNPAALDYFVEFARVPLAERLRGEPTSA